jgi:hypothetical protein
MILTHYRKSARIKELFLYIIFFYHCATAPSGPRPPHYPEFIITLRHTTLGSTPLEEWSAQRRDLYMITYNTHSGQTSMLPAGFEPTIPASERPQTHALDRAAIGIGSLYVYILLIPKSIAEVVRHSDQRLGKLMLATWMLWIISQFVWRQRHVIEPLRVEMEGRRSSGIHIDF